MEEKHSHKLKRHFNSIVILSCLLAGWLHYSFILFFYFIDVKEMMFYNIASTFFFFITYLLLKNKWKPNLIYILISIEIVLHAYLSIYFIGYDCGFIYFILVLPPIFLLNNKWEVWLKYIYLISIVALFFVAYFLLETYPPIYTIEEAHAVPLKFVIKLIVVVSILIEVSYFGKIVNENDKTLREVNYLLSQKNKEKVLLMKEMHHRIKNNFQVVVTLLKMQASKIEDDNLSKVLQESQNRVLSMAKLHESVYASEDFTIDTSLHFDSLIKSIIKNQNINKKIDLDISIPKFNFGINTIIPLGLIINEIITNSLKYAFNETENGLISIKVSLINQNMYELLIADNGVGHKSTETEGLGSKLIKLFTKQLKGSVEKINQKGTAYRICFENIDEL